MSRLEGASEQVYRLLLAQIVAFGDEPYAEAGGHAGSDATRGAVQGCGDARVVDLLHGHVQGVLGVVDKLDDDLLEVVGCSVFLGTEEYLKAAVEEIHVVFIPPCGRPVVGSPGEGLLIASTDLSTLPPAPARTACPSRGTSPSRW
jgi:hypothetical protein